MPGPGRLTSYLKGMQQSLGEEYSIRISAENSYIYILYYHMYQVALRYREIQSELGAGVGFSWLGGLEATEIANHSVNKSPGC